MSIQNKLAKNFHLVYDEEVSTNPCCFDPPMMVKCCFQVWEKRNIVREKIKLKTSHKDWKFLNYEKTSSNKLIAPQGADFAIRAYGGNCGEIVDKELNLLKPKSWHWIKSNIDVNILKERLCCLDYKQSRDTARQDSIGRGELVKLYSEKFEAP